MRPLTASELLLMEELFSTDLKMAQSIEITEAGISGSVSARQLAMKPQDLIDKARARAECLGGAACPYFAGPS